MLSNQALAMDEFNFECLLAFSLYLRREKEYSECLRYMETARKVSQDIIMWECIVDCHLQLNNVASATTIARDLVDKHADLSLTWIIAGKVAEHEKSYELCRKFYSRCMEMCQATNCAQALLAYVDLELHTGRVESAKELLEEKIPYFHTDWLYAKLGDVHVLLQNWAESALSYNMALSLNPFNQQANVALDKLGAHFRPEENDLDDDEEYEEEG